MKRAYFCLATKNFDNDFEMLNKSFKKFHKEDIIRFNDESVPKDAQFFFRATPYFTKKLFNEGYDEVCHLDADQIILGNLDHIWEGGYDVAVVLNSPAYPIGVWDIGAPSNTPYFNNGLNVFRNKEFINHWLYLCYTPHFNFYQFREQDLLNILCSDYFSYKVRILDGDKIHGEYAKPEWKEAKVVEGKVMIADKELLVIHFGGGS